MTTITAPVSDLSPMINGPRFLIPGVQGQYTFVISNIGTAPTVGVMNFTVHFSVETGLSTTALASSDWTFVGQGWTVVGQNGGDLNYQSDPDFSIPAGGISTGTFGVTQEIPGSFTISTTLPTGIGGETNADNNSASITVVIPPPPG